MLSRWGLLICQVVCLGLGGAAGAGALHDLLAADADGSVHEEVRRNPADAYLWADAAWAAQIDGDEAAARAALIRSWQFAPHSRNLALYRAQLGVLHWPLLSPTDRVHLMHDMGEAQYLARPVFKQALARSPRFAAVWRASRRHSSLQKGPPR